MNVKLVIADEVVLDARCALDDSLDPLLATLTSLNKRDEVRWDGKLYYVSHKALVWDKSVKHGTSITLEVHAREIVG